MINTGFSLQHVLDTESARRGLTRADMIECLRNALTENFKRRGKIVTVVIDDTDEQAVISVTETILTGGRSAMYREVSFIPPFSPELLAECIEQYAAQKQQTRRWTLAEAKVVSRREDHYLLEILSTANQAAEVEGEIAVLPFKSVSEDNSLHNGDVVWAVVRQYVHSEIDGGYSDPWRNVPANWIASRTESEFLSLMAYKLLNEPVHCLIHTSRGIMIFPAGADLMPLLANEGRYINMLKSLTGLKRLAVARKASSTDVHTRLSQAIRAVAGLAYGKDFVLGTEHTEYLPKIYVDPKKVKVLVGKGGHNLFFIKCVSGMEFEFGAKHNLSSVSASSASKASTLDGRTAHVD